MVTLTVRTSLAILTVSVIIMVVVATGYMDKDMASAFDVWWKPFAIGMGIAVFPLVALVMIENKAHEKIVKMLPPISRNTIPFNKRQVDDNDNDDDDAKPRERSESEELKERFKRLGPLPRRSVTGGGGGGGEEGETEERDETQEEKAARLAKIQADLEKETRGIESEFDESVAKLTANYEEEREKLLAEANAEEEDFEAKNKEFEEKREELEKQIENLEKKKQQETEKLKAWKSLQKQAQDLARKNSEELKDKKDIKGDKLTFTEKKEDPGGEVYTDFGEYTQAMKRYKKEFEKYLDDLREYYRKREESEKEDIEFKRGDMFERKNKRALGIINDALEKGKITQEKYNKFLDDIDDGRDNQELARLVESAPHGSLAEGEKDKIIRKKRPSFNEKKPEKPKRPKYDPGDPPPPPMYDDEIRKLQKSLSKLSGPDKVSGAQAKLDQLDKKHQEDLKKARNTADSKKKAAEKKAKQDREKSPKVQQSTPTRNRDRTGPVFA